MINPQTVKHTSIVQGVSPWTVISMACVVTMVGSLESLKFWPYAPYLWGHAFLCIIIPYIFRFSEPLNVKPVLSKRKGLRVGMVLGIAYIFIYLATYFVLFNWLQGADTSNLWSVMRDIFQASVSRYGFYFTWIAAFLLLGVWAPIGEELFYRKFLFNGMRQRWGFMLAAFISSSFFGLRHSLQLLYLLPAQAYPIISGMTYFLWAGAFGFLFAWIFEKTGSIKIPMIIHGLNILWSPIVIYMLIK